MQNVTKNYILNLCYNVLILLVPLVTTPYISRVLGAEGIGIYNYCLSISTYFIVAGTLGLPLYAKREIAYIRDDKNKLSQLYSELITLQFVLITISLFAFVLLSIFYKNYTYMLLTCGVGIIAALFDISWLYIGLEDFTTIVSRGVIFKIISVALIFSIVKDKEDIYIYGFSIMIANLIGNLWMFFLARKKVDYIKPSFTLVFSHVRPAILLLLPNVVTTIYAVIDKTLLGAISSNMSEVGYYEQSQKIITLTLTVVTSLGAILMPRIASLFSNNDREEIRRYLNKGLMVISFISFPLSIGLLSISNNLVPWFFGSGFDKVTVLLKIFSPMIVLMGISDLLGTQLMIAFKMEKKLFIVNASICLINIVIDIILIPHFLSYGAAFATLFAECIKTIICLYYVKDELRVKNCISTIIKYLFSSALMGILVYIFYIRILTLSSVWNTLVLILIGMCSYFLILLILKDQLIFDLINRIKTKIN